MSDNTEGNTASTELSPRDRQLANLKAPWPKGVSGNPVGKLKGTRSFSSELRDLAAIVLKGEINPLTELPEDMPVNRKIALNLIMKAVADADLPSIREFRDTLEGKPTQSLNIGGQEGENPLQIDNKLTVELVSAKAVK